MSESREQLAELLDCEMWQVNPVADAADRRYVAGRYADAILASDWYAATLAAERERISRAIEAELDDRFNKWRDVGLHVAAHIARSDP